MSFRPIRDELVYRNNRDSPMRYFYAPDKFTIISFSGSISGNLLSSGGSTGTPGSSAQQYDDPLSGIGSPISPWDEDDKEDSSSGRISSDDDLIPPVLNQRFNIPGAGNIRFDIDYNVSPTGSTELQFDSTNWKSYDDVNWNSVYPILASIGGSGNLNFRMNHTSGLYSNTVTFSGNGTWRLMDWETEPDKSFYSTSYGYSGTLRPFPQNPVFSQSNMQYTIRGTLFRSIYQRDRMELEHRWGSWAKEQTRNGEFIPGLNNHRLTTNIMANVFDNQQSLSTSIDLPPMDPLISINAAFRYLFSETSARITLSKPELINNRPNEEWRINFNFTEILIFTNYSELSFNLKVDPDENNKLEVTSISSSLSLWNFRASFTALKTYRYTFKPDNLFDYSLGGNWERYGTPDLYPSDLTFSYRREFAGMEIIKDRLSFSMHVNSSLGFDLIRYTNSSFLLQFGFNLGVSNFMDLKLSLTSENTVIFRYFKGIPGMENLTAIYKDGPQNNILIDLIDSFNFFDESKRRRSGFKMKSFNLSVIHYLGDWRAELDVAMFPHMTTSRGIPRYEVSADVSFLVQWVPISEIRSDIRYEGGADRWTVR